MSHSFIEDYDSSLTPHLPNLKQALEDHLRRLIEDAGLFVHSIDSRIKTALSLEKKLVRPDRSYQQLIDVTDLLGFRIVTFSEDMIPEVARLIENTYDVDFGNSVNKLHQEDSQRFGYRSLHYVCSLPDSFISEGASVLKNFKFEIQIRTILQHAWAEIEHDIGYKSTEQLPREFRRRFSQIAGLLEVADREFASIRTDLKKYEDSLKSTDFYEGSFELDQISLESIIKRDEIKKLDLEVSRLLGLPIGTLSFYPDYLLHVMRSSGLKRLGDVLRASTQLKNSLEHFLPAYFDFAKKYWGLETGSIREVQKGYGLLFIAHLWILGEETLFIDKVNRLTRFYGEIDYPNDPQSAKSAAQSLVASLKASQFIKDEQNK